MPSVAGGHLDSTTQRRRTFYDSGTEGRVRTPISVWVLTAAFVLLCATWSILTPQLLAPDESAHFSSALRMSQGFDWPDPGEALRPEFVQQLGGERAIPHDERSTIGELREQFPGASDTLDQMTQHPPPYYMIAGGLIAALGGDDLRWDVALLSMRLLGAILAAPLIWLTWNTIRRFTRSERMATVAAMVPFAVPGLAQMLGVANNDTPAILMGSVVIWLAVRVLTGDRRLLTLIGLAAAFGLAGLAKGTLISLAPLVVLVLFFGRGRPAQLGPRIWQTVWPLLIAFVFGQWWWLRNLALFGTLQPYGYTLSDKQWPAGQGPSLPDYVEEVWRVTATSFWGWFGRVNAPLPQILVDVLTVTCLLVVLVGIFRRRERIVDALIVASPIAVSLLLLFRVSWATYADTSEFRGLHGRYFYPVIVALVALGALGASNIVREAAARVAFGRAIVIVSTFMSFFGLAVAYVFFYASDNWSAWRSGVRPLLDMASTPPAVTLVVPAVYGVLLLVGAGMTWIAIRPATTPEASVPLVEAAT
ncbi:DUF2142 domain-containing protein [Microbacterium pumilum]